MLTVSCLCAGGEMLSLPTPVYMEIRRDENVPADSLRVIFSCSVKEEISQIYIDCDEQRIFCGVVDEQTLSFFETERTEVVARSMAAVLLDNEARPHGFVNLSTQVLFEKFIKPYGIESYCGDNRCLQGNFDVLKGMSCFEVAENFSKSLYGTRPEIAGDIIYFFERDNPDEILFSNEGGGVPFSGLEFCRRRCKLISKVRAKTENRGEYSTVVADTEAVNSGIVRERFLDVSPLSGDALITAYKALEKSRQNFEEITLKCPVQLVNSLYANAKIISSWGVYENFRVKSVRYVLNEQEEYTRLTLCRKEK